MRSVFYLGLVLGISACQSLPSTPHLNTNQTPTKLLPATTSPVSVYSGYYPIASGADAFASRSILSDLAKASIDIQYYIWHDDEAGQLMLKDLWEAANRGVKIRLLLDDFNSTPALDKLLLHFSNHPNISVRLANPAVYRKFRPLNFVTEPLRINRRMHNKSMTFDNQFSIVGGRNIGNEYLNNNKTNNFADLDVLLTGAIVKDINASFESYWQSPLSYDIETLIKTPLDPTFVPKFAKEDLQAQQLATKEAKILRTYRQALETASIGKDIINNKIPFRWGMLTFVADPATKLTGNAAQESLLISQLKNDFGEPQKNFSIISSYFVPTKAGVEGLIALSKKGVKIQILTNSYRATDVGSVHAGYAHWRKDLLKAGIKLYELKATAPEEHANTIKGKKPKQKENATETRRGQSRASLHAKAFAVDDQKTFIGSYNLDPRSANINSELGVIIEDPLLATKLHNAFGDTLLPYAYEVKLNNNALEWHTLENQKPVILYQEPQTDIHEIISTELLSWMPIDWLL